MQFPSALSLRATQFTTQFSGVVPVAKLLHELAHYIVDSTYVNHQSHGKQFVGVYMHLLDKYRIMPNCAFRALAKKCKVKIAGRFKPDAIRG